MARKLWREGKRISIGELANAVGVSRVTLYRWVGSKDRLIEEVLWSYAKLNFEKAKKTAPGTGVEHIVETHRRFMTDLGGFEPMRRFVLNNPASAIRIQTNDPSSAHGRVIIASATQLVEQVAAGHLQLHASPERLAEIIVFTNGALLYSALVGGRDPAPAIEQACFIDRLLLEGEFGEKAPSVEAVEEICDAD